MAAEDKNMMSWKEEKNLIFFAEKKGRNWNFMLFVSKESLHKMSVYNM